MKPHIVIFSTLFMLFHSSFSQTDGQNTTYFILPEFVDGTVLMKSGNKNKLSINYNAVSEEMIFVKGQHRMAIGNTESELIDTVFMADRKFIRLDGKFVEVLEQTQAYDLYAQHKCKLDYGEKPISYSEASKSSARENQSLSYSTGLVSESRVVYEYIPSPYLVYYFKQQGEILELTSLKQVKKLYKEKQNLYKSFVKENDVAFENADQVADLIYHLESTSLASNHELGFLSPERVR